MQMTWILVALLPVAAVLGLGTTVANSSSCAEEGGATVSTTMVAFPSTPQRAKGVYFHAAADGTAGVYLETNDRAGLQTTPKEWVCGNHRTPIRNADEMILDYLA